MPTLCPAWKRGHCTGECWYPKQHPQPGPDDGALPEVKPAAACAALRYGLAQGWILDETARGSVNIQEAVDRVTHAGQAAVALHTRGRHGGPAEGIIVEPSGMVLVLAVDMVRGVLHASRVRRACPQWTIQVYTPPRAWPFSSWAVLAVMWHLAPEDAPTGTAEEIARDFHTWPANQDYPWRRPRGGLPVAPAAEGLSLAATLQRHPDKQARHFLQTDTVPATPRDSEWRWDAGEAQPLQGPWTLPLWYLPMGTLAHTTQAVKGAFPQPLLPGVALLRSLQAGAAWVRWKEGKGRSSPYFPLVQGQALLDAEGMGTVEWGAIGYQALHLPRPQDALRHARQQVTKAWAQHGGWPTSFPKEAMMAHWRYYGDNTGALVDMAYAKHAAHLLHRVTHNHQPEVREAAAIRIKEAQMARNTCPRWILAQHGVSTPVGTGIWAQLQLLLPHHTHAILTNHHCDQQGPLVATHTDIHRHPAGEVDTLRLVGATITIVYITPTQMQIMAQCDAHHAPFLSDPQWPARHVFQAYLRACATKAGRDMPGPKDIDTAYTAFQRQHPRPRLSEHETPNDGGTTQGEPTPSAEGWTPPTILLLAPNGHKHVTRTVQRHHAPWSIPKHNAPEADVPPVRHSDQGIPRKCWHCGPAALDTPWPLLHLISTHYHTPTAAATADQQAWLSPWFHTVPPDHPAHVAWTRTPTATWTFTNEQADPDSVAMEYDRCDPHRAGPQEAPMRPLQHKCPTLRGDKDDTERRQTITCQKFHPNTGYLFHLMYAYITQGRPDRGLLRLTPRAQAIITQGIGVYAAPLLQPTQITARTTQGNPIYVYHPTAIARLPIPSDTDIIYFTDASGTQQRTPTVGCASVRITRRADGLHVEHHTGTTIFGASSHGELRTMADAVTATPPPTTVRPRNIWVVVDATVDIHLTRRLADLPLHKALDSGLTTQALGLWMAFKGMHPQDALHIVKQESHRYAYGNGRADTQAKHQNTNHTPGLERVRLDAPHHSHLQHLPPIPLAAQPPQWMPEDTPYTDRDKQYHYPTPIQQLAATLGHPANTELLRRLENSVHTPLYYSALRPDSLPAHLQKPRLQLALEQLPLLTRYHRWYTRRSIHVPAGHTKCICSHAEEETWDHFKACPLYRGLDTLTDWNPTHTIAQHAGWLAQSPATQQLTTVLKQTEVLEAVRRGLVPTAVYTLLRTHAEDPQATAAHMQRTAVAKTAEQLTYRTHKYLQHAATLPPTDQAHLLKLLFYQP